MCALLGPGADEERRAPTASAWYWATYRVSFTCPFSIGVAVMCRTGNSRLHMACGDVGRKCFFMGNTSLSEFVKISFVIL